MGVVKWKIRDRTGFTGSKNHEMGVSGLAYRDDSIGDSWGYAHTLTRGAKWPTRVTQRLTLGTRRPTWGA